MANISAQLDLHKESHTSKNVSDNKASALVEAAKKGILVCESHPGFWISKPGNLFGVQTRDCPLCLQDSNIKLSCSSSPAIESNHRTTAVQYSSAPSTQIPIYLRIQQQAKRLAESRVGRAPEQNLT